MSSKAPLLSARPGSGLEKKTDHTMSTSPHRSPKALVRLVTSADQPAAVQAVSLALGVLRHAGVGTWAELVERFPQVPDGLVLSDEQIRLLADWEHLFPHITWGLKRPGGSGAATVSLAVCPACGRWEQVVGSASTRCRLKLRCSGVPVKATVARKAEGPRDVMPASGKEIPQQTELLATEPDNAGIDDSVDDLEF
jgi:hypothetical protein